MIKNRAWKTSFNPDPYKQTQEIIFSGKIQKSTQPPLIFNIRDRTLSMQECGRVGGERQGGGGEFL